MYNSLRALGKRRQMISLDFFGASRGFSGAFGSSRSSFGAPPGALVALWELLGRLLHLLFPPVYDFFVASGRLLGLFSLGCMTSYRLPADSLACFSLWCITSARLPADSLACFSLRCMTSSRLTADSLAYFLFGVSLLHGSR